MFATLEKIGKTVLRGALGVALAAKEYGAAGVRAGYARVASIAASTAAIFGTALIPFLTRLKNREKRGMLRDKLNSFIDQLERDDVQRLEELINERFKRFKKEELEEKSKEKLEEELKEKLEEFSKVLKDLNAPEEKVKPMSRWSRVVDAGCLISGASFVLSEVLHGYLFDDTSSESWDNLSKAPFIIGLSGLVSSSVSVWLDTLPKDLKDIHSRLERLHEKKLRLQEISASCPKIMGVLQELSERVAGIRAEEKKMEESMNVKIRQMKDVGGELKTNYSKHKARCGEIDALFEEKMTEDDQKLIAERVKLSGKMEELKKQSESVSDNIAELKKEREEKMGESVSVKIKDMEQERAKLSTDYSKHMETCDEIDALFEEKMAEGEQKLIAERVALSGEMKGLKKQLKSVSDNIVELEGKLRRLRDQYADEEKEEEKSSAHKIIDLAVKHGWVKKKSDASTVDGKSEVEDKSVPPVSDKLSSSKVKHGPSSVVPAPETSCPSGDASDTTPSLGVDV